MRDITPAAGTTPSRTPFLRDGETYVNTELIAMMEFESDEKCTVIFSGGHRHPVTSKDLVKAIRRRVHPRYYDLAGRPRLGPAKS